MVKMQPDFLGGKPGDWLLGDDCHMQNSGAVPVCVITDMQGNILLRNFENPQDANRRWLLTKAKAQITRFWSASTAFIQASCSMTDVEENAPSLQVPIFRNTYTAEEVTSSTASTKPTNPTEPSKPAVKADDRDYTPTDNPLTGNNATPKTTGLEDRYTKPTDNPLIYTDNKEDTSVTSSSKATTPTDTQTENTAPLLKEESETKSIIGVPTLPDLPLYLLDEICIYMGYLRELRPVTTDDLRNNLLLRVFIGVVDTIRFSGTVSQGEMVTIECRDRMKYLMDSLGSYNTADFIRNELIVGNAGDTKDEDFPVGKDNSIKRSDIIIGLAKRAVGDLSGSRSLGTEASVQKLCDSVCGLQILPGWVKDIASTEDTFTPDLIFSLYSIDKEDKRTYSIGTKDKPPFIGGATRNSPIKYNFPIPFNVISGRLPYATGAAGAFGQLGQFQNFQVTERVPVEYIRYLANQEPWPTEFFCDHRSGEFWYAPRGLDLSGFSDKKRFFRTYFYKTYPDDLATGKPHVAQMCRLFREEVSTINWRSNILVTNSDGEGAEPGKKLVHLKVTPPWLIGRKHACTYHFINEPSARAEVGELAITALMFARLIGKDTRAGSIQILGDPSLCPGEAIQVVGSYLSVPGVYPNPFNNSKEGRAQWVQDRINVINYYNGFQSLYTEAANKVKNATTISQNGGANVSQQTEFNNTSGILGKESKKTIQQRDNSSAAKDMCIGLFGADNVVTFPSTPRTIFRVEGVIHRWNDGEPGYYTELALLDPY